MKIKSLFTLVALLIFSQNYFTQDVKIKKGLVTVDGKEYVKVDKSPGIMSVYDLSGENEMIFIKLIDPTPSNNKNHDQYYVVRFIEFDLEVEIDNKTRKGIIKLIYKGNVIDGDSIDEEKMKTFVSKYGSDVTRGR